jgi:predicted ATP-grasp superfamily ATP-dependent carboligase
LVPSAFESPEAYTHAVYALAEATHADVIVPVTEASHLALFQYGTEAKMRSPMSRCVLAAARDDAFLRAADKALVRELAAHVGIAVPGQETLERHGEAPAHSAMPCVVKPARSVSVGEGPRLRGSVGYATTEAELRKVLAETPASLYPLLIQERVSGSGLGVSLLRWEGRTIAVSGHRRLLEKPVEGGVSVACETIEVPEVTLARCEALLAALGYTQGLAMIEFKGEDLEAARLMEINPRLWGSVQLAIDAEVDFPNLLVSAALGVLDARPSAVRGRPGVRLRWWWGSVDHALQRVLRRLDSRGRPQRGGRLAVLLTLLRTRMRGAREEVWRFYDPWPFFVETRNWLRKR